MSESHEQVNDAIPKNYQCFCSKIYTTYPGIYLHLKAKHANLFQKYKKLKISKLFKKVKNFDGIELYRLEKISDKEPSVQTQSEKNQKFLKQKQIKNSELIQIQDQRQSQKSLQNKKFSNESPFANFYPSYPLEPNFGNPYLPPNNFRNGMPVAFDANPYRPNYPSNGSSSMQPNMQPYYPFPSYQYPFSQILYPYQFYSPQPVTNFHPSFNHTQPRVDTTSQKKTIQSYLQDFLNQPENKEAESVVRPVLNELTAFIDANYQQLDDPRVNSENKVCSYSAEMGAEHIQSLIEKQIEILKPKNDENIEKQEDNLLKIDVLERLRKWISSKDTSTENKKTLEKSTENSDSVVKELKSGLTEPIQE